MRPGASADFQTGVDRLDLSRIDANEFQSGNQAFTIVNQFTGVAGQLTVSSIFGNTFVTGDTDGDRAADFQIQITGVVNSTDITL